MAEYLSDQEQIEKLKKLWAEYGVSILLGAGLSLAAWFSWVGWSSYQENNRMSASSMYQSLLKSSEVATDSDLDPAVFEKIKSDYGGGVYDLLARFQLVNAKIKSGDVDGADQILTALLSGKNETHLQAIGLFRSAKIAYAKGDFKKVIAMLDAPVSCKELQEECIVLKADAARDSGDLSSAEKLYREAIAIMEKNGDMQRKSHVTMKINDMKVMTAQAGK